MRGLQKTSLSTPKTCLKAHKQTVTVFECNVTSLKVSARCSNAHRTGDTVTGSIAMASTACQANHADMFHNLGGFDMHGLKKANMSTPKSCPKAHKQTVTVFECVSRSLKGSAQCRKGLKSFGRYPFVSKKLLVTHSCKLVARSRTPRHAWIAEGEFENAQDLSEGAQANCNGI